MGVCGEADFIIKPADLKGPQLLPGLGWGVQELTHSACNVTLGQCLCPPAVGS